MVEFLNFGALQQAKLGLFIAFQNRFNHLQKHH